MISLAEITKHTRTGGKIAAIAFVVILFLFFSYRGIVFLNGVLNPPQAIPPDMRYGELMSTLPLQTSKPSYVYQINTTTGTLPTFPDRIRVYKTVQPEPDLLALQKTRDIVSQEGLQYNLNQEVQLSPNEYRWTNAAGGTITYNTLYKNFSFTSGIGFEDQNHRFEPEDRIISETLSFLQRLGSNTAGIDQKNFDVEYFRSDGTNLIPEPDITKSYLAKLNLYHINVKVDPFTYRRTADESVIIESLPIYYQNSEESNQTFILKAGSARSQVIQGTYSYFPVNTTDYSTYPLKTSQQAFEDLQNGNAYILGTNTEGTVDITEVQLGYFIPQIPAQYVMPIYVFSGKNFTAYVDAIGEFIPQAQNVSN